MPNNECPSDEGKPVNFNEIWENSSITKTEIDESVVTDWECNALHEFPKIDSTVPITDWTTLGFGATVDFEDIVID